MWLPFLLYVVLFLDFSCFANWMYGVRALCSVPRASEQVPTRRTLKKHTCVISQSWRPHVQYTRSADPAPPKALGETWLPQRLWGRMLPASSGFWWLPASLACGCISTLCFRPLGLRLCLYLFFFGGGTLVIELGAWPMISS